MKICLGQYASDRPDLVTRVFKIVELLKDIHVNHVLGKTIAYVHVIEYQKQGLHCHMISEEIDSMISAYSKPNR